ncbi:MAG TPA: hypothetical protein VGS19_27210 [Streptosporangiaceae bacterium]|nr:hypothetical protein [Streptosporangiaceae bacterium]
MPRNRSLLSRLRRDLYLSQRALGTVQAASRGPVPLGKRLGRRRVTRSFFRGLRRRGLW